MEPKVVLLWCLLCGICYGIPFGFSLRGALDENSPSANNHIPPINLIVSFFNYYIKPLEDYDDEPSSAPRISSSDETQSQADDSKITFDLQDEPGFLEIVGPATGDEDASVPIIDTFKHASPVHSDAANDLSHVSEDQKNDTHNTEDLPVEFATQPFLDKPNDEGSSLDSDAARHGLMSDENTVKEKESELKSGIVSLIPVVQIDSDEEVAKSVVKNVMRQPVQKGFNIAYNRRRIVRSPPTDDESSKSRNGDKPNERPTNIPALVSSIVRDSFRIAGDQNPWLTRKQRSTESDYVFNEDIFEYMIKKGFFDEIINNQVYKDLIREEIKFDRAGSLSDDDVEPCGGGVDEPHKTKRSAENDDSGAKTDAQASLLSSIVKGGFHLADEPQNRKKRWTENDDSSAKPSQASGIPSLVSSIIKDSYRLAGRQDESQNRKVRSESDDGGSNKSDEPDDKQHFKRQSIVKSDNEKHTIETEKKTEKEMEASLKKGSLDETIIKSVLSDLWEAEMKKHAEGRSVRSVGKEAVTPSEKMEPCSCKGKHEHKTDSSSEDLLEADLMKHDDMRSARSVGNDDVTPSEKMEPCSCKGKHEQKTDSSSEDLLEADLKKYDDARSAADRKVRSADKNDGGGSNTSDKPDNKQHFKRQSIVKSDNEKHTIETEKKTEKEMEASLKKGSLDETIIKSVLSDLWEAEMKKHAEGRSVRSVGKEAVTPSEKMEPCSCKGKHEHKTDSSSEDLLEADLMKHDDMRSARSVGNDDVTPSEKMEPCSCKGKHEQKTDSSSEDLLEADLKKYDDARSAADRKVRSADKNDGGGSNTSDKPDNKQHFKRQSIVKSDNEKHTIETEKKTEKEMEASLKKGSLDETIIKSVLSDLWEAEMKKHAEGRSVRSVGKEAVTPSEKMEPCSCKGKHEQKTDSSSEGLLEADLMKHDDVRSARSVGKDDVTPSEKMEPCSCKGKHEQKTDSSSEDLLEADLKKYDDARSAADRKVRSADKNDGGGSNTSDKPDNKQHFKRQSIVKSDNEKSNQSGDGHPPHTIETEKKPEKELEASLKKGSLDDIIIKSVLSDLWEAEMKKHAEGRSVRSVGKEAVTPSEKMEPCSCKRKHEQKADSSSEDLLEADLKKHDDVRSARSVGKDDVTPSEKMEPCSCKGKHEQKTDPSLDEPEPMNSEP